MTPQDAVQLQSMQALCFELTNERDRCVLCLARG